MTTLGILHTLHAYPEVTSISLRNMLQDITAASQGEYLERLRSKYAFPALAPLQDRY